MELVVLQTVRIEMDGIVDDELMRLSKVSSSRRLKLIAPMRRKVKSSEALPGLKADVDW